MPLKAWPHAHGLEVLFEQEVGHQDNAALNTDREWFE